jgi:hypothetical protein
MAKLNSVEVKPGQSFTVVPHKGASVVDQKTEQLPGSSVTTIRYSDGTRVVMTATGARMHIDCNRPFTFDEKSGEFRIGPVPIDMA